MALASSARNSWNLENKLGDGAELRFSVPKHVRELRDKVLKFVEEECYPMEEKLHELGDHQGGMGISGLKELSTPSAKAISKLQEKAKAMGLWALGHPKAIGGQGIPFRDYIYVNEVVRIGLFSFL